MKKFAIIFIALLITRITAAQKKSSLTVMPDINKLMKMTPAEIEVYKKTVLKQASNQVKQISEQNNFKIDEMTLPDFELKMPLKDIKRLTLLPSQPPTMVQLVDELRKSKQQIETLTPKAVLNEINVIAANQTPAQMQSSSIAEFYSDKPVQALLISMQSALKNAKEVIAWNNLAAIYNMCKLEHRAIPILMHHLQQLPTNPMLLNNMGQAYLGLGELPKAKDYLQQCLIQDPLNPEANRSMGLVCLFERDFDKSKEYFEKEIEVTQRESTISLLEKKGFDINVYLIRDKNKSLPDHNFFDEIQLNKFKVPPFPTSSEYSRVMLDEHSPFRISAVKEQLYWGNEAVGTPELLAMEGKQSSGLYAKQVKRLLKDLHKKYTPYDLSLFTDININQLKSMIDDYGTKMGAVKCPSPPAGASMEVILAYERKCCEIKKPIIDAHIAQYNALVTQRINFISGVWKQYINKLINIVSLDPSSANRRYVCGIVSEYFLFLGIASQAGIFPDPPSECHTNITSAAADSIIESSRQIDLHCPPSLNLEIDLQVAKLKADCSKFSISGGQGLRLGFDHSFKTGTSTLSGGVGMKASFLNAGGVDASEMLFISWGNNNQFSDFGLKVGASVKVGGTPLSIADGIAEVGGTIAAVEGGYSLGINSGFNVSVKGKGLLSDVIKYEY
jgi:tetratricopeptide (TPR) repeat protein